MIKTLTKIFAFTAVTKSLLETKKSQSAGTTQIHPSKIPGRTVFIREKEYFIRENIIDGTTPIIFLHSWVLFFSPTFYDLPLNENIKKKYDNLSEVANVTVLAFSSQKKISH